MGCDGCPSPQALWSCSREGCSCPAAGTRRSLWMERVFWVVHLGCKCSWLGDVCTRYRRRCFPGTQGSQEREEEWWPRLWPLGGGGPWPGGCASGEGHLGRPSSHGHGMSPLWGQPCLGAILATPRGVSPSPPVSAKGASPPRGAGLTLLGCVALGTRRLLLGGKAMTPCSRSPATTLLFLMCPFSWGAA